MIMPISSSELRDYVQRQLNAFFPDGNSVALDNRAYTHALERAEHCLSAIKGYRGGGAGGGQKWVRGELSSAQTYVSHLHNDQYATILYFLANTLYHFNGDILVCDKLTQLLRLLSQLWCPYTVELPPIFNFVHPAGSVLSNLVSYGNYISICQNVTVGGNPDWTGRTTFCASIGVGVMLSAGVKLVHFGSVGDYVTINPGVCVHRFDVPSNRVLYLDKENRLVIKEKEDPLSYLRNSFIID